MKMKSFTIWHYPSVTSIDLPSDIEATVLTGNGEFRMTKIPLSPSLMAQIEALVIEEASKRLNEIPLNDNYVPTNPATFEEMGNPL